MYGMSAKDRLALFEKKSTSDTKKGGAGPKKIGKLNSGGSKGDKKSDQTEGKAKKETKKKEENNSETVAANGAAVPVAEVDQSTAKSESVDKPKVDDKPEVKTKEKSEVKDKDSVKEKKEKVGSKWKKAEEKSEEKSTDKPSESEKDKKSTSSDKKEEPKPIESKWGKSKGTADKAKPSSPKEAEAKQDKGGEEKPQAKDTKGKKDPLDKKESDKSKTPSLGVGKTGDDKPKTKEKQDLEQKEKVKGDPKKTTEEDKKDTAKTSEPKTKQTETKSKFGRQFGPTKDKQESTKEKQSEVKKKPEDTKEKPSEIKKKTEDTKEKPSEIKKKTDDTKEKPIEVKKKPEDTNEKPSESKSKEKDTPKDKPKDTKSSVSKAEEKVTKDKLSKTEAESKDTKDKPSETKKISDKPTEIKAEPKDIKGKPSGPEKKPVDIKEKPSEPKKEPKDIKDKISEPTKELKGKPKTEAKDSKEETKEAKQDLVKPKIGSEGNKEKPETKETKEKPKEQQEEVKEAQLPTNTEKKTGEAKVGSEGSKDKPKDLQEKGEPETDLKKTETKDKTESPVTSANIKPEEQKKEPTKQTTDKDIVDKSVQVKGESEAVEKPAKALDKPSEVKDSKETQEISADTKPEPPVESGKVAEVQAKEEKPSTAEVEQQSKTVDEKPEKVNDIGEKSGPIEAQDSAPEVKVTESAEKSAVKVDETSKSEQTEKAVNSGGGDLPHQFSITSTEETSGEVVLVAPSEAITGDLDSSAVDQKEPEKQVQEDSKDTENISEKTTDTTKTMSGSELAAEADIKAHVVLVEENVPESIAFEAEESDVTLQLETKDIKTDEIQEESKAETPKIEVDLKVSTDDEIVCEEQASQLEDQVSGTETDIQMEEMSVSSAITDMLESDMESKIKEEDLDLSAELEANLSAKTPDITEQPQIPEKEVIVEEETVLVQDKPEIPEEEVVDKEESVPDEEEKKAEVKEDITDDAKEEVITIKEQEKEIPVSNIKAVPVFKPIPEEFYDTLFYFSGMGTVVGSALSKGVYVPQRATKTALDVECIENYESVKDDEIMKETKTIRTARHQANDLSEELKKLQSLLGGLPTFKDTMGQLHKIDSRAVDSTMHARYHAFQPIGKPRKADVAPLKLGSSDGSAFRARPGGGSQPTTSATSGPFNKPGTATGAQTMKTSLPEKPTPQKAPPAPAALSPKPVTSSVPVATAPPKPVTSPIPVPPPPPKPMTSSVPVPPAPPKAVISPVSAAPPPPPPPPPPPSPKPMTSSSFVPSPVAVTSSQNFLPKVQPAPTFPPAPVLPSSEFKPISATNQYTNKENRIPMNQASYPGGKTDQLNGPSEEAFRAKPLAPLQNQPKQGGARPLGEYTADPKMAAPSKPWQEKYGSQVVEDTSPPKPFEASGHIPSGLKPWELSRMRGLEARGFQFSHEAPKSGADHSDSFYHGNTALETGLDDQANNANKKYSPFLVSRRSQSADREKKTIVAQKEVHSVPHSYTEGGASLPYSDV